MESNIVKLAETLKERGVSPIPFFIGEVVSTNPLSISINQSELKKNLYIDESLLVCEEAVLAVIFAEMPEDTEKDKLLRKFFENYILKIGDKVIAYQDDLDFYVLAKVGI